MTGVPRQHGRSSAAAAQPHRSRLVRSLLLAAGSLALLLGLLGIFLPVLPTTPFVLLAAACFARSSERLHRHLLAQRHLGPIIQEWEAHRAMPPGVKPWAYALMALSFSASILLMDALWHRAMLLALALVLGVLLWRVPVRPRSAPDPAGPDGSQPQEGPQRQDAP